MEPQLTVGSCGHSPGSDWLGELTQARRGYLITWGLRCQARFLLSVATWLLGYHPGLLMMAKPLQVMGDVELLGAVVAGGCGRNTELLGDCSRLEDATLLGSVYG